MSSPMHTLFIYSGASFSVVSGFFLSHSTPGTPTPPRPGTPLPAFRMR